MGVLDTCLIPAEFADTVRARAAKLTGIPADRIMLSATHTHSAPSLMRCLGTDADPNYPAFLIPRIVEGLQRAVDNLAPARVGWAVAPAPEITGEAAPDQSPELFVGGRSDQEATFEGRIDEVAIYNRALSPQEIRRHYQLADTATGTVALNP